MLKGFRFLFRDTFELILFLVSMGCALFVAFTVPVHFNCDSMQYLRIAWKLTGDPRGEYYYYRTPGLSLLMLLTGVTVLNDFRVLIGAHILMAAFMPSLLLRAFTPLGKGIARAIAILTVLSFVPYRYITCVMTDHSALFLQIACLGAFSRYLRCQTMKSMLVLTVLAFVAALVRPSAGAILLPILVVLAVFGPRRWGQIALSALLFSLLSLGYSFLRAQQLNPPGQWNYVAAVGDWSGMSGRMLFWNMYCTAGTISQHKPLVSVKNGPATSRMDQLLRHWTRQYPAKFAQCVPHCPDENALLNELFTRTNLSNHGLIWVILDEMAGPVQADQLFRSAAYEALKQHPEAAFYVWYGVVDFFTHFDVIYNAGERGEMTPLAQMLPEQWGMFNFCPDNPFAPMGQPPTPTMNPLLRRLAGTFWQGVFLWQFALKIVAVVLLLCTLPFWMMGRQPTLPVLCASLALYQAVVSVLFAAPHIRYIDPVIPLLVAVAVVGAGNLLTWWRQHAEPQAASVARESHDSETRRNPGFHL